MNTIKSIWVSAFIVASLSGCGKDLELDKHHSSEIQSGETSSEPQKSFVHENVISNVNSEEEDLALSESLAPYMNELDDSLNQSTIKTMSGQSDSWKVDALLLEFGLNEQRRIGPVTERGSASAIVVYRHPDPAAKVISNLSGEDGPISDGEEDYEAPSLDEIATTIEATGKVKNMTRFREELAGINLVLTEMAAAVNSDPRMGWKLGRVRLELIVDVSGKIIVPQGVSLEVGSDIRFRFDWDVKKKVRGGVHSSALSPLALSFRDLATQIAYDLSQATDKFERKHSSFRPKRFRIGFGMTGKFHVGVVKGGASALGHLLFDAKPKEKTMTTLGFAPVIEKSSGYQVLNDKGDITWISEQRFQKGLNRAFKIAGFFANQAERHDRRPKNRKWIVRDLRAAFEMSALGDLGLVSAGGIAMSEVTMSR